LRQYVNLNSCHAVVHTDSCRITFLIAGHETTSGLLSFVFYNLIKNSAAYRAAQKEVDEVCGKGPVTVDHIPKLKYITAVLREALRLNPTAPTFSLAPHPDLDEHPPTIGKGKYSLEGIPAVVAIIQKIQRDPKVYGPDANEFKPERVADYLLSIVKHSGSANYEPRCSTMLSKSSRKVPGSRSEMA
jgi:cytochrome P450